MQHSCGQVFSYNTQIFEDVVAGNVTITLFWDMTPYTLVDWHQCFGEGADCSTVRIIASSPSKYKAAGN
jgi:hypothetical protein